MSKRMTDLRLDQISGLVDRFPKTINGDYLRELLQALKAERDYWEQHICRETENEQRIRELESSAAKKDNTIIEQQKRISELEAKLEQVREIRQKVKGGIEVSAGLDDEIGVYWQETFLDMIDKELADD